MKILIANNQIEECGVHQYGKRIGRILQQSTNHDIKYLELSDKPDFMGIVDNEKPNVIVYNYLGCILPWCSPGLITQLRQKNIKQGTIIHNSQQPFFDFNLHQDPNYNENPNNYRLLRPLLEYDNDIVLSSDTIKIGSFGFGSHHKNFPVLCQIISDHYSKIDKPIELKFHLTVGAFANNNLSVIQSIEDECQTVLKDSKISLTITTDFISDEMLLDFLAGNHINLFLYPDYDQYNGISSSTDFALSAKRPIGISTSSLFSHINQTQPSICFDDANINDIVNNGIEPLKQYYERWSNKELIKDFERVVDLL